MDRAGRLEQCREGCSFIKRDNSEFNIKSKEFIFLSRSSKDCQTRLWNAHRSFDDRPSVRTTLQTVALIFLSLSLSHPFYLRRGELAMLWLTSIYLISYIPLGDDANTRLVSCQRKHCSCWLCSGTTLYIDQCTAEIHPRKSKFCTNFKNLTGEPASSLGFIVWRRKNRNFVKFALINRFRKWILRIFRNWNFSQMNGLFSLWFFYVFWNINVSRKYLRVRIARTYSRYVKETKYLPSLSPSVLLFGLNLF